MKTTKTEIVKLEFTGDEIAAILIEHAKTRNLKFDLYDYEVTSALIVNEAEEVHAELTFEGTTSD